MPSPADSTDFVKGAHQAGLSAGGSLRARERRSFTHVLEEMSMQLPCKGSTPSGPWLE